MTGFIYVIAHPKGWRKIGRASDPASRLRQHQRHSGEILVGEAVFACDDPIKAERVALRSLAALRIMGEWFDVDFKTAAQAVQIATRNAPLLPFPSAATKTPAPTAQHGVSRPIYEKMVAWFEAHPDKKAELIRELK